MKAQINFVEFLTSMTIFLAAITYVAFQISIFVPNYLREIKAERMKSEAYQLSELLINDLGEPIDWYKTPFVSVVRLGLSDETKNKTNLLSQKKISAFQGNCSSNYTNVKNKLGLDYDFSLILKDVNTNEIKIDCHPLITITRYTNVSVRRIVAYTEDNQIKYGEMLLQMW